VIFSDSWVAGTVASIAYAPPFTEASTL